MSPQTDVIVRDMLFSLRCAFVRSDDARLKVYVTAWDYWSILRETSWN